MTVGYLLRRKLEEPSEPPRRLPVALLEPRPLLRLLAPKKLLEPSAPLRPPLLALVEPKLPLRPPLLALLEPKPALRLESPEEPRLLRLSLR